MSSRPLSLLNLTTTCRWAEAQVLSSFLFPLIAARGHVARPTCPGATNPGAEARSDASCREPLGWGLKLCVPPTLTYNLPRERGRVGWGYELLIENALGLFIILNLTEYSLGWYIYLCASVCVFVIFYSHKSHSWRKCRAYSRASS